MIRTVIFSLASLFLCQSVMAQSTYKNDIAAPKITTIRGQESYVEEINLGPAATEFWKRLQALIADHNLSDFSDIATRLDLRLTEPLDAIDLNSKTAKWRSDIRSKDSFIESGNYGVFVSTNEARTRFIGLRLVLNQSLLCLSKTEVRRVFNITGEVGQIDGPCTLCGDQTGYSHGIGLAGCKCSMYVNPSGCINTITMDKMLD